MRLPESPLADIPRIPLGGRLWSRALVAAWVVLGLFFLDQLTVLLSDLWLLQSMKLESVFWTNFKMGATLFLVACVGTVIGISMPAMVLKVRPAIRKLTINLALIVGLISGYVLAMDYLDFLLFGGADLGKTDPVFGHDLSFYLYDLPNYVDAWEMVMLGSIWGLLSAIACSYSIRGTRPATGVNNVVWVLGSVATPATRMALLFSAIVGSVGIWLSRYQLLFTDNKASGVWTGAEYIDVVGLFSNVNYIYVTTVVVLGIGVLLWMLLGILHDVASGRSPADWRPRLRKLGFATLGLIALDFGFKLVVELRDILFVGPNEPVVQIEFIGRHVDATRAAYGIDKINEMPYRPSGEGDPLPSVDKILASASFKNLPLWPGFVSWLEHHGDSQHSRRVLQTKGDTMVYGPARDVFRQEQKLRTYYDFMNVDTVRYKIGDEMKMFVSGVRELPMHEPSPWLAYWGTRFMLFTHGYGIAAAPVSEVDKEGSPLFASYDIPPKVKHKELELANQSVYYGEGSATMCFTNVKNMKELDFPTEQDRAEVWLPQEVESGVYLDSLLKRAVLGWRAGKFFDVVFSGLITDETRAHYIRQPLERLDRVAKFLYFDSNPYAVAVDGKLYWMVNAMTTSDTYPYSYPEDLGDKSDERSLLSRPERRINYVEDSVKVTVDAYTGKPRFYKMSNDPVISTWAKIYPDLFVDGGEMPAGVRAQITYSSQLFHLQFDDLYNYYHMKDPMYFFNQEDMWDDADEVLGAVMDEGKAITFSFEPYNCLIETGGAMPAASTKVQYSLVMPFTPEKALNLRGIPMVYQDGADYGKLSVLQIPKGHFVLGPEQADALVDQVPEIAQNFSWWNRRGLEVIRGHTTMLLLENEVIYVEPIFLRSKQNPVSELKKVVVTFRGKPAMADTAEEALRKAMALHAPAK